VTPFHSCRVERRVTTTAGRLDLATGETVFDGPETTEVRECGTPLFSDERRASGICRSCAEGWEAPGENEFTEAGLELVCRWSS